MEIDRSSKEIKLDQQKRSQQTQMIRAEFDAPGQEPRQLPLWEDYFRGLPNEIARSSLFSSRNRSTKRVWHTGASLFVLGDAEVLYRGEELRQIDEVVWLQVLHLARSQPLNEWVEFVPGAFLKAVGWSTSVKEYDRLKATLARLQATSLQLQSKRLKCGVSVSLIRKFEWKDRKQWRVMLEPEMQVLFPDDYYSKVMWTQRLSLPSGIASKLPTVFLTTVDALSQPFHN